MGICHSACGGASATQLEYYNEAYRHQIRHRAQDKLIDESLPASDASAAKLRAKQRQLHRRQLRSGKQHSTQLWLCDDGCCSIRWKLDYAAFQSYTNYAHVSPYVVVQDQTGRCTCVICCGLPETADAGDNSTGPMAAVLRKACVSRRMDASALQQMRRTAPSLPEASVTASLSVANTAFATTTAAAALSEGSTTDNDDDDDRNGNM